MKYFPNTFFDPQRVCIFTFISSPFNNSFFFPQLLLSGSQGQLVFSLLIFLFICFLLPLGGSFNQSAIVRIRLLCVHDLADVLVKLLAIADVLHVLHDFVRLYVELGHAQGELILITEHALLQVVAQSLLQHADYGVSK